MNLLLAYDTETTGLPDFKAPSEAEHQPHIVQIAAALVDLDSRKTIASIDLIVRPEGWEIPEEVSKVHGITTEHAAAVGVREEEALTMFLCMWHDFSAKASRRRLAHNESFDARIIRIALMRYKFSEAICDGWKDAPAECTARLATPIVKAPPTPKMIAAGRNHYKTANLSEAYKHFTGLDLVDAHSALADVNACIAVYFAILDQQAAAEVAA